MRVLITGGLGCVGSQIAREYLDAGHSVVVVDACEEKRNEWARDRLGDRVWLYRGRMENAGGAEWLRRGALPSCDAVVHAAASTGIPHSAEHPDDDWVSNVDATKVLLDALREHPLPTVILSSVKPYKVPDEIVSRGLRETDPLEPDEPYAASKAAQSMLAVAWARSYDLPVVTLRCSNLYGPAPCHGPRHGWLTWFCISSAIGRPLQVQGGGAQARDMLFGTDVHRACEAALSNARTLQGRIFNIGGGHDRIISVRAAAERLRSWSNATIVEAPGRRHEDQLVYVDHTAFTRATGWRPEVSVEQGMMDTFTWAMEHASELRSVYEGV